MSGSRRSAWGMAAACVLAAWGVHALVSLHAGVPETAEDVAALFPASREAFDALPPEARWKVIRLVSEGASQLPLSEREALGRMEEVRRFPDWLTEDERLKYIQELMPRRLSEALRSFSERPAGERAEIVERAIERMRKGGDGRKLTPEQEEKFREGVNSKESEEAYRSFVRFYMSGTNPQQRSELAPLVREVGAQFESARNRAR